MVCNHHGLELVVHVLSTVVTITIHGLELKKSMQRRQCRFFCEHLRGWCYDTAACCFPRLCRWPFASVKCKVRRIHGIV